MDWDYGAGRIPRKALLPACAEPLVPAINLVGKAASAKAGGTFQGWLQAMPSEREFIKGEIVGGP